MKKKLVLWAPTILWMALIFTLSSIPKLEATSDPLWNLITRKIAHFSEYMILFFLLNRSLEKKHLLALILTIAYAISDEVHQSFVHTRSAEAMDVAIDAFGALSAWWFTIRH